MFLKCFVPRIRVRVDSTVHSIYREKAILHSCNLLDSLLVLSYLSPYKKTCSLVYSRKPAEIYPAMSNSTRPYPPKQDQRSICSITKIPDRTQRQYRSFLHLNSDSLRGFVTPRLD